MPNILHRHLWNDSSLPWKEEDLQIAIAEDFRKRQQELGFAFAADMNGLKTSKRSAGRAKAAGMQAGEPDLRVYLPEGRIGFIELKRKSGTLSAAQKERHALLLNLGHDVRVLKAACPAEAVEKAVYILNEWISWSKGVDKDSTFV